MEHICPVCDRKLSCSKTLKKHMAGPCQRKLDKQLEKICPLCHDTFSSVQMCKWHIDNKVCTKNKQKEDVPIKKIPMKFKSIPPETEEYDNMSKEELIDKLKTIQPQVINNITVNNSDNRQIINNDNRQQTSVFMPQSYPMVRKDWEKVVKTIGVEVILDILRYNTDESIQMLCSKIHDNDKFPQYRNAYMSNDSSKVVRVFVGGKFVYRDRDIVVDELFDEKCEILGRVVDVYGAQLGEEICAKCDKYRDEVEDDPKLQKACKREIEMRLIEMRYHTQPIDKEITEYNKRNYVTPRGTLI